MTDSRQMAGLIGPSLMAVTASEFLNLPIWATGSPPLIYLNGAILFVAGLAIVRMHNLWTWRWPVCVTLVGWLAMAGGLYRMFLPTAPQLTGGVAAHGVIGALFGMGCLLTAMSLRPKMG
ncbi:MAG: hypothetical protein ACP5QR_15195 [Rhizomicrobium sp.]